jgi:NTP pyrophosphatase (non-canonical NTP hydrolase)
MNINDYQDKAYTTALPSARNSNYMLLGLLNEAGEMTGVVKKYLRGDYGDEIMLQKLTKEIGDTLWYLAGFASTMGINLDEIAQANLDKLQDRMKRGVLMGDGDNR